jgi:hypothetical protein
MAKIWRFLRLLPSLGRMSRATSTDRLWRSPDLISLSDRSQVSYQDGENLAMELGIPFLETSALSGENVESAFVKMTTRIKASIDRRGVKGVSSTGMTSAGGVVLASGERQMTMKEKCGCN